MKISIDAAHRRIRSGDFVQEGAKSPQELLEAVLSSEQEWRRESDLSARLKGLYVAAEVFDYFGRYDEVQRILQERQDDWASAQVTDERDPTEVTKRRAWVLLALATHFYRLEGFDKASQHLAQCGALVEILAKKKEDAWGTRARLAYSWGQLLRQRHQYGQARRQFGDAIRYARKRLLAKARDAQCLTRAGRSNPMVFDHHRLLATWTAGKALSLGLGYIAYTEGKLAEASSLVHAGHMLLYETGDRVHRAYSTLLLGAIGRAAARDERELTNAIATLEDAESGLAIHKTYGLRASYEVAKALALVPQRHQDARTRIDSLVEPLVGPKAAPNGSMAPRWKINILVLASRFEAAPAGRQASDAEVASAKGKADLAFRFAANGRFGETSRRAPEPNYLLAEACISRGEILALLGDVSEAREMFDMALRASRGNAKLQAVVSLHLSRTWCGKEPTRAERYFSTYERLRPMVEHAYVRNLATRVREALDDSAFIAVGGIFNRGELPKESPQDLADRAITHVLLRMAANGADKEDMARYLGVEPSSLKNNRYYRLFKKRSQT